MGQKMEKRGIHGEEWCLESDSDQLLNYHLFAFYMLWFDFIPGLIYIYHNNEFKNERFK